MFILSLRVLSLVFEKRLKHKVRKYLLASLQHGVCMYMHV